MWVSATQGKTWSFLGYGQFPPKDHARLLSTSSGVLILVQGSTQPKLVATSNGQNEVGGDWYLNDLYASLDGKDDRQWQQYLCDERETDSVHLYVKVVSRGVTVTEPYPAVDALLPPQLST